MPVTFESVRFGPVEVSEREVIEFPNGLIGLGGRRYALLDRNPGTPFRWLHCVEDPALALPVVAPDLFFEDFVLALSSEELEKTGIEDLASAEIYVTVRAMPNPLETTANLRAPLVIHDGRGFQVLNDADGAELQAPLFELAAPQPEPAPADAA
jgi:flagellar assembly factor FliW